MKLKSGSGISSSEFFGRNGVGTAIKNASAGSGTVAVFKKPFLQLYQ